MSLFTDSNYLLTPITCIPLTSSGHELCNKQPNKTYSGTRHQYEDYGMQEGK